MNVMTDEQHEKKVKRNLKKWILTQSNEEYIIKIILMKVIS